ncbi:hypothetical protein KEM52_005728, partial [Ascosphaera acerosa]
REAEAAAHPPLLVLYTVVVACDVPFEGLPDLPQLSSLPAAPLPRETAATRHTTIADAVGRFTRALAGKYGGRVVPVRHEETVVVPGGHPVTTVTTNYVFQPNRPDGDGDGNSGSVSADGHGHGHADGDGDGNGGSELPNNDQLDQASSTRLRN